MLVIFGDTRSLEQDELEIRRKTLRGSVLLLGWWYLVCFYFKILKISYSFEYNDSSFKINSIFAYLNFPSTVFYMLDRITKR